MHNEWDSYRLNAGQIQQQRALKVQIAVYLWHDRHILMLTHLLKYEYQYQMHVSILQYIYVTTQM